MIRATYYYRETFADETDEIITLCKACANKRTKAGDNLEQIDRSTDGCGGCEADSLPMWYNPKPAFVAGVINDC